jgi:hypothetical protein
MVMCRNNGTVLAIAILAPIVVQAAVPTPEGFLGRRLGEDRYLAPWPQVVEYFKVLDAASDRVTVENAGASTLGNEMPVVVVTSEENGRRLDHWRDIARRLANADRLSEAEVERLVSDGRAVVLVTCSIHSNEVGSTQMSMELAHELATTEDPEVKGWLDEVILLLMPSINPDGQVLVIDWYNEYLGTEYEGGRMPWLYHHYVGHDNNRDFFMLTQKETQAVNDLLYHRWFPQVFLDEHQMGSTGPRMFVPPQTDPLAPEVHSLVFRQADLLGTMMALRLEKAGKRGVGSNMIFDSYWPGGTRNTAWWKNVTGLLTEVASARFGTPIYVDPGELRGGAKGFPKYQRRANFPSPWEGGWWRLRDIIDYELVATKALLETVARHRAEFLSNVAHMVRGATERGRSEAPFAFVVEPEQHDPVAARRLVELLQRHGVRVFASDDAFTLGRTAYAAGTVVIPTAQPYRAFLLTMLRPQRYPEVIPHVGGPVLEPYDATSWSLPVSMGVAVSEAAVPVVADLTPLEESSWPGGKVTLGPGGYALPHAADSSFAAMNRLLDNNARLYWLRESVDGAAAVGDIWVPAGEAGPDWLTALSRELHVPILPLSTSPKGEAWRVQRPRVGLYKPWVASMDEGWTRFVLERYGFAVDSLHNDALKSGSFTQTVDVLVFPDVAPEIITDGKPTDERSLRRWSPLPPEYAGGVGKEGGDTLAKWVRDGGSVVALDEACGYLIDLFELPVANVIGGDEGAKVVAPGTMLRLLVDTSHPLGYGMRTEEAGYFNRSPAFRTRIPDARFGRQVVARYPDDVRDMLISGYLEGGEALERRAAVVDLEVGEGRVVLIGLRPQHRAQTVRTFKLLFNALYLHGLELETLK